jgi:hypothetical protein
MNASNAVIFEGATADAHETTLSTVDATADRTINLPNQSGTLPVLAAASATAITSTPEELNILDGATVTVGEINLIDGDTSRGTTAVASGDGILINDGGTMRMTNVDTVSTYFASHTVGGGNIVTTGALGSGSIAAGFGAIDNGTSGITTGGNIIIDVDADADDNTADSSTGRLTIGAGGDLNLYHGGTHSYIVNSTGSLYIHSEVDDSDIVFTGEDGSSGITALTLDMSDAGTAIFNHDITLPDNGIVKIGTGGDLQLLHDATHSYIHNATGTLYIKTASLRVQNAAGNETILGGTADGSAFLAYNDTTKIETTNIGVTVTGTIIATTDTDTSNTGNVKLDFAAKQNFVLTLTGNTTLVNPSTEQVGQSGFIAFIQDGTGGRTITLGTDYETAGGLGITLTSAASKTDLVPYVVVAAGRILLGTPQRNFS